MNETLASIANKWIEGKQTARLIDDNGQPPAKGWPMRLDSSKQVSVKVLAISYAPTDAATRPLLSVVFSGTKVNSMFMVNHVKSGATLRVDGDRIIKVGGISDGYEVEQYYSKTHREYVTRMTSNALRGSRKTAAGIMLPIDAPRGRHEIAELPYFYYQLGTAIARITNAPLVEPHYKYVARQAMMGGNRSLLCRAENRGFNIWWVGVNQAASELWARMIQQGLEDYQNTDGQRGITITLGGGR